MDTSERLIRFRVVAAYHRYDSKGVSVVIHPDQSMAQIIQNVRRVSIARKTIGLWKNRPAWAMVQYSNGEGRWRRSRADRPIFIRRSENAQKITSHPKSGTPARIRVIPKSSLNTQKGMPIVKLRKTGLRKNFSKGIIIAFTGIFLAPLGFATMVSLRSGVFIPGIMCLSAI
jgi:hypothetical protein